MKKSLIRYAISILFILAVAYFAPILFKKLLLSGIQPAATTGQQQHGKAN